MDPISSSIGAFQQAGFSKGSLPKIGAGGFEEAAAKALRQTLEEGVRGTGNPLSGGSEVQSLGGASSSDGVGSALKTFVQAVDAKGKDAEAMRVALMTGESNNIHQTMIAMQESSVAFTLMVEVRNKAMETYQELMRMQV